MTAPQDPVLGDGDEPTHHAAVVKDRDGYLWQCGRKRVWRNIDGDRGWLTWLAVVAEYGPLRTDSDTEAREAAGRARRRHQTRTDR